MRILFEVLLLIIIALFAYKAFGWLFPCSKACKKQPKKTKETKEGEENNIN